MAEKLESKKNKIAEPADYSANSAVVPRNSLRTHIFGVQFRPISTLGDFASRSYSGAAQSSRFQRDTATRGPMPSKRWIIAPSETGPIVYEATALYQSPLPPYSATPRKWRLLWLAVEYAITRHGESVVSMPPAIPSEKRAVGNQVGPMYASAYPGDTTNVVVSEK